jgi:hypothetical protein
MLRSAAIALAVLAAIDSLMFHGAYMHVVRQVVDSVLQHML